MEWNAPWIQPPQDMGSQAPLFTRSFHLQKPLAGALLEITGLGIYEASINGCRISQDVLAPGWTAYQSRLQVQQYDVTGLLKEENELAVMLGKGWYRSPLICWRDGNRQTELMKNPAAITARLTLRYQDQSIQMIQTDEEWQVSPSPIRFSELYDGEIYDACFIPSEKQPVCLFDGPTHTLIPQEGPPIREMERLLPARVFTTPKGERIIDFGQEICGFLETEVDARAGDVVDVSFGEVLDREGNFYNENYRDARCLYRYICREGRQRYKTHLTFYGFRYIRINQFPGGVEQAQPRHFTGIAVHSLMRRTGALRCSDPMLNQLFSNILWGQKSNFLDVPTDCPQRDERLGWMGDAQVFARTACLLYDTEQFFAKWLADMAASQHEDGYIGPVIPDVLTKIKDRGAASAAWGDAATIVPWEVYRAFGNRDLLRRQLPSMKKWVDFIGTITKTPDLWIGCWHYGDWLGLDAPSGSSKGSSRDDLIASAFYARSTELVIRASHVLGEDVSAYEALYDRIVAAFRKAFPTYQTQTECILAAHFRLAEQPQQAADQLARLVEEAGVQLKCGFVGTPYLLHVLSDYGHADLAYQLLLRREYPSWLYPITKGATTMWEHWDGIMEDGSFWRASMNSFNHYAYGSVADWVFGAAAGIRMCDDAPGYQRLCIAPQPSHRLDWLEATLDTRHGKISVKWSRTEEGFRYDLMLPVETELILGGKRRQLSPGNYVIFD